MKRLDCAIDGCHATIEAESEDAVMTQVGAHAAEAHPDLELDDETVEGIRSQIMTV